MGSSSLQYISYTCGDVDNTHDECYSNILDAIAVFADELSSNSSYRGHYVKLAFVDEQLDELKELLNDHLHTMCQDIKDVAIIPMREAFDEALDDKDSEISRLEDELDDTTDKLESTQNELDDALTELSNIRTELEIAQDEAQQLREDIEELEQQLYNQG